MNWSPWITFNKSQIEAYAPLHKGVYALWEKGELVYYGMAEDSTIMARLLSHQAGYEVADTQNAESFCFAVCTYPADIERQLLESHRDKFGKLPKYNSKVG